MVSVLILADNRDLGQPEPSSCLSEVEQLAHIERLTDFCQSLQARHYLFIFQGCDEQHSHLKDVAQHLGDRASIFYVAQSTRGTACTALLGIQHIRADDELLILNGELPEHLDAEEILQRFRAGSFDAGKVVAARAFPVFGFTWFAKGQYFIDAAKDVIRLGKSMKDFFTLDNVLAFMSGNGFKVEPRLIAADESAAYRQSA